VAFEAAGLTFQEHSRLSGQSVELIPTTDEVERLRWAKDPDELASLQAAQDITDEAFDRVVRKLVEGSTEHDVALELDTEMRRLGSDGISFDTIVAFGENAAEPHHHPGDRDLRRGDVVKFDFGAVVDGYHADMTRTVAFGEPPGRLAEMYEIVRTAQRAGLDAVRAGVTGDDADRASREIVTEAGYGDGYKHSLGHGVGLDIHEGPTLRSGSDDVLPEHTVVTVEPGVYVEGLGGVRIEDMVEVGAEGARVMPKTPKELLVL
jgi:Xaa-Pro aminopeptidase